MRSWAHGGAEGWSAPDGRTQLPPPRQTGWLPSGRGRTQLLIHNVYCVTAPGGLFTQYDTLCYGAGHGQCRCREAHGLTNHLPSGVGGTGCESALAVSHSSTPLMALCANGAREPDKPASLRAVGPGGAATPPIFSRAALPCCAK